MIDLSKKQVGRAVGWRIVFPDLDLRFDHGTHYAGIEASLSSGLAGGSYKFTIEGVNNSDFRTLALARYPSNENGERAAVLAKLYLYWRDLDGDDPSEVVAPPVATLAITSLSRKSEGIRLLTTIEARELIYDKLEKARIASGKCVEGNMQSLQFAFERAGLASEEFKLYPPAPGDQTEGFDIENGAGVLAVLTRIGERIAESTNQRGRGIFLIRDGVIHAGAERPIPHTDEASGSGEPITIKAEDGLISAEPQGQQKLSAAESRRNAENGLVSAARDTYTLTMAGRPVLKPGDVVVTEVDTVEAAVFGGFGLPPLPAGLETSTEIELYVNSVQHRLGKNIGWITTVTGVVVDLGSAPEGVWDMATPAEADSGSAGGGNRDDADPARAVVHHIRNETQAMMRLRERPRVGEVRANNHATEIGDQVVSKAAQSLDLLIGLDVPDGKPRRARRQELRRVDERRLNVPYLTPFAWGPYGLVLPHYPGERVLVVFHEDSTDDPVVLGSFWQTAQLSDTSAPPNVEPGDWWLILPAGLDAAARQSVAGADSVALPSDAKAVHDLITAEGERIIEIAGITVRSVPTDELGTPQGRPTGGANGGLLIEHKNGARIHIDAEGGITVQAKKKLILKADEEVEIEGSSIKLKGSSVDVE